MLIVCAVFAVSDVIAYKTRAIIGMALASSIILLVMGWMNIVPNNLFSLTNILPVAVMLIPVYMVFLGTMISIKDFIAQWRTVIIALAGVVGVAAATFTIGFALFKLYAPEMAFAYAGASTVSMSGGVVALLIINPILAAKGYQVLTAFTVLVFVLHGKVAMPLMAWCLSRRGKIELEAFRAGGNVCNVNSIQLSTPGQPAFRIFPPLPSKMQTPFVLLGKAVLVGWLAVKIAAFLGPKFHPMVVALIFGILAYEIGFLEYKILDKANAGGFFLFILLFPIYVSIAGVSLDTFLSLIIPAIIAMVVGTIGCIAGSLIMGKLLKYPWDLSIPIGLCCFLGFPFTLIIAEEVSNTVGQTQEEKNFVFDILMPKTVIAGFATVSIGSVILAGIIGGML